jgi:hypothetical protein
MAYCVENNYEYFHVIQKTEVNEAEEVIDIEEEGFRMKSYNFIKGLVRMFEVKEEKRIMKMNVYFYTDHLGNFVLFDI